MIRQTHSLDPVKQKTLAFTAQIGPLTGLTKALCLLNHSKRATSKSSYVAFFIVLREFIAYDESDEQANYKKNSLFFFIKLHTVVSPKLYSTDRDLMVCPFSNFCIISSFCCIDNTILFLFISIVNSQHTQVHRNTKTNE